MKRKILSYLSIGTLITGAVIGGYALVKIRILRAALPAGTCPVTSYRPQLYVGIALCLVSFVLTMCEKSDKKSVGPEIGAIESGDDRNDAR